MVRRTAAAGGGLLVLILLVLGVRGCLDARKERAFQDYVQDVSTVIQESNQQGRSLFELLSAPGGRDEAVDVENSLNGFRVQSAQLVDRARDIDHPDELSTAQRYLLETLEFRRDGLAEVADGLPTALGDQDRRQGTEQVTLQMQSFLASDVVYSRRFATSLAGELRKEEVTERIPRSQFLPDIDWLEPGFVSDRVARIRTGGGGETGPGLHGNGLGTVSLGGQSLTPGGSATVKLSGDLSFQVQVANQGDSTETDVTVRVTVGRGGDAVEAEEQLDTIGAGETKTVTVPLRDQPATGQNVPITVEVEPVPGEEKTDNNEQTYSAIFTR
jgi:CARDB